MKDAKEAAARHEGCDNGEVGGLDAGAHKQHHIGVFQPLHQRHFSFELLHTPQGSPCSTTSHISWLENKSLHKRRYVYMQSTGG